MENSGSDDLPESSESDFELILIDMLVLLCEMLRSICEWMPSLIRARKLTLNMKQSEKKKMRDQSHHSRSGEEPEKAGSKTDWLPPYKPSLRSKRIREALSRFRSSCDTRARKPTLNMKQSEKKKMRDQSHHSRSDLRRERIREARSRFMRKSKSLPPDRSSLQCERIREARSRFMRKSQPPLISDLRVVLLGNSWSQRSSVINFILGGTVVNTEEEPGCCLAVTVQLEGKKIVLINTPDLLHPNISENKLTEDVNKCVRLSDPGPHVFLLVLQPEDFTEEHKGKLCRVLQRFSDRSFDHSLVLMSTPRKKNPGFMEEYRQRPPLKDLIRRCQYRFLWQKNLELPELLTRFDQIVKENNGEHLSPRGSI